MAYSNYGAFVYENGKRRKDKEDVDLFATDMETFGEDSANIPSGARIFVHLLHMMSQGRNCADGRGLYHGVLGDGDIRVGCYKYGLPEIYEQTGDGLTKVKYTDEDTSYTEWGILECEYKGYKFKFISSSDSSDGIPDPYIAEMITPEGYVWRGEYGYNYGAGFESELDELDEEDDYYDDTI